MKQIEIQGCRMELIYLTDERKHCHQDIELIYLIERQASVDAEESYTLKANDIAVINSNIEHSIRAEVRTTAFRLLIPYRLICRMTSEEVAFFQCNSSLYISNNYSEIRKLTEMLLLNYLNMDSRDLSELVSIIFRIIHELFGNFSVDPNKIPLYLKKVDNDKIDRIIRYI
ncbi:MAG TPA: cupin domain-containing protein, partial [Candidatus Mediterraneibacter excrementigallinarum]|nr:cupin domain-containing protein [Candidatus Mediterraneibacter excrementigallinarum]